MPSSRIVDDNEVIIKYKYVITSNSNLIKKLNLYQFFIPVKKFDNHLLLMNIGEYNNYYYSTYKMNKMLKYAYTKFWVPVMGRFISKLIPIVEGRTPEKPPTFDIDGGNLND